MRALCKAWSALLQRRNRQNVWYKEFTVVEGEINENIINLTTLTLNAFFTVKF